MPGFDKTGPDGLGAGTGRRAGGCFSSPANNVRPGGRMRNGNGRGIRGRGFRCNINQLDNKVADNAATDELPAQTLTPELDQRLCKIENTLERLVEMINMEPEKKSDA